jgi:transcriptional regulator with XRE-family HTH domain
MSDAQTASPDADPVRQIGARLKLVRTTLELSQTEFAERLGSSRSAVSEAERGEGNINATIILGIATHFPEVNLDWLITGRDEWLLNAAKALVGDVGAPKATRANVLIEIANVGTMNIYLHHAAEAAFRQGGAGA